MRRYMVVGWDATGMPYVINEDGHIVPVDELAEVWTLSVAGGQAWIECC